MGNSLTWEGMVGDLQPKQPWPSGAKLTAYAMYDGTMTDDKSGESWLPLPRVHDCRTPCWQAEEVREAGRLPSTLCNAAFCKHVHPAHDAIAWLIWDIHLAGQILKAPAAAR